VKSFYFSAYHFGAIVNRAGFPLCQKPGQITPADALVGYQRMAPGERLTEGLATLLNAQAYREVVFLRAFFSHRLSPGGHGLSMSLEGWEVGPDWSAGQQLVLESGTLRAYHAWLEGALGSLAEDLDAYAQSRGF
jgi:hypothetical protein